MRIGYPCLNRSLACTASGTFRLKSYSPERLVSTVTANLSCLEAILACNRARGFFYFRISSDLIPFASHPVCGVDWGRVFRADFRSLGRRIREMGMRIAMHPDQFTLLNSPSLDIRKRSMAELIYHAQVLDALELESDAKIQIHIGGVYGQRPEAMARFVEAYRALPEPVRRRLVIENDDRQYSLRDALELHDRCGVPVLFDVFHDQILPSGFTLSEALRRSASTWRQPDGLLLLDYSQQRPGGRVGAHAEHLRPAAFRRFLTDSRGFDFDLMLEIKDKELSAALALKCACNDERLYSLI
jgi:UV DNA damage endonuclease